MGTTAEKGAYTIETKSLLKQKINNLGGSIDDNTTFRNYANQLQNVYDNLPKTEYQEGTEVNLGKTIKGKLDFENGVVGIGQSSQATRQYIDVGTWEQGSIDGTTGANITNSGMVRTIGYIEVKPNILYELSRSVYSSFMILRFYDSSKNYVGSQATTGMVTTNKSENRMNANENSMQMTIKNTSVAYMRMADASNDTSTIYTIYTDNTPSPVYPQPIQCVTGNQDVVVSGKNLFDSEIEVGNISSGANSVDNNVRRTTNYVSVKPSTDYIFSINGTANRLVVSMYTANKTFIDTYGSNGYASTNGKFTTTSNTYYVRFRCYSDDRTLFDEGDLMLEEGTTVTTYEPYITPTTHQLSLGDIQLCGIGNYADELIYDIDEDKVYKNEKIGKVVYNGTESNWVAGQNTGGTYRFNRPRPSDSIPTETSLCNYFNFVPNYSGTDNSLYIGNNNVIFSRVIVNGAYITDLDSFKAWLGTHTPIVYYPLQNAVETEIADTTLINQVKALYNAQSINGTTIITSNGDLPLVIKVRGLKGE